MTLRCSVSHTWAANTRRCFHCQHHAWKPVHPNRWAEQRSKGGGVGNVVTQAKHHVFSYHGMLAIILGPQNLPESHSKTAVQYSNQLKNARMKMKGITNQMAPYSSSGLMRVSGSPKLMWKDVIYTNVEMTSLWIFGANPHSQDFSLIQTVKIASLLINMGFFFLF